MKRNSTIANRIGAGFVALFFFILSANTIAGISVSPLQQSIVVKPGGEAFFSVTITNVKRRPETPRQTVSVEVVDFMVSPYGRLSFGEEFKHSRSAVEWINFDGGEFVLKPGESKEIKTKVSAPSSADGDYWAAFMVGLDSSKKPKGGVQVKLRTASGVFIHVVRRTYIERGSIINTNVTPPEFAPEQNPIEESAWEQSSREVQKEQVLKIRAELKNDGLTALIPQGKAFLYSGNRRMTASIPLYAARRRILPGDSRYFTGVMSQPLPAGQYKMRTVFDPGSKNSRKITKDTEFTISEELARRWAENFADYGDMQALKIKPQELELTLTPGRFTAARFMVANKALSTVAMRCRVESNGPQQDWLKLKSTDFTLAPNTQRTVVCLVRIPPDAQPGLYNGTIHVEMERSGLTAQRKDNVEQYKIPVRIVVNARDKYTMSK